MFYLLNKNLFSVRLISIVGAIKCYVNHWLINVSLNKNFLKILLSLLMLQMFFKFELTDQKQIFYPACTHCSSTATCAGASSQWVCSRSFAAAIPTDARAHNASQCLIFLQWLQRWTHLPPQLCALPCHFQPAQPLQCQRPFGVATARLQPARWESARPVARTQQRRDGHWYSRSCPRRVPGLCFISIFLLYNQNYPG